MQKTIIRPRSGAAVLRTVPALIGMHPTDSVVMVVFDGNRSCGALRVDLPPDQSEAARRTWLTTVMSMVMKVDGADGVMPVVYTSAKYRGDEMREAELLRQIWHRADLAGIVIKRLFCVAANGYGEMRADRLAANRRPLADLGIAAATPKRERHVATREQDAFEDRVADWLEQANHEPVHGIGPDGHQSLPFAALDGAPIDRLVEAVLAHHTEAEPPNEPCECHALFGALLSLPATRDVMMLQIAWGPKFGRHAARRLLGRTRPTLDEHEPVVQAIEGGDMVRPDLERIRQGIEAAQLVAGFGAVGLLRAPALATAGWLAWAAGRGSIAGELYDGAIAADPDYSFAQLLGALMDYRMLPEWAYRPIPESEAARRWLPKEK